MTMEEIKAIAHRAATCTLNLWGKPLPTTGEPPKEEIAPPITGEPEEECHCDNLLPMEEWLAEEDVDGEQCHECILQPIVEFYIGALQDEGAEPQIKQLREAWASEDLLTIGEVMDKIKSEVGESLKKRLNTYDCYAQTYKPEAAEDEKQQD